MTLSNSKSKICFFFQDVKISLANKSDLKKNIQSILKKENRKARTINFIFCSDKALLKINRKYLKHNFYTDIITFDLSETSKIIEAEIYISVDRVRENAQQYETSLKAELHRVIFHGLLHLCGYRDKTEAEKNKIREKEDFYLEAYL